jgi:Rieske Fe-S protein
MKDATTDPPGRRSVLAAIVTGGIGLITAGFAGLAALVAAPAAGTATRRWRRAASTLDVPHHEPYAAVIAERHDDGWYSTRKQSVVFIDREGDGYRALSAVCAHLGCRVRWSPEQSQYQCPCHGGVYDREGRVVAGPPPGPLERYNVRVNAQTSEIEVEL